jgi:hypothetical protein
MRALPYPPFKKRLSMLNFQNSSKIMNFPAAEDIFLINYFCKAPYLHVSRQKGV